MAGKLLTVEEAAERLAMAPATIRDWIGLRKIATVKFGTHRRAAVRIEESEVERLIAAHRRPAWTPPARVPRAAS
jgi:excisionase family DNA binding protein